jgi:hypothetical protein
MRSGASSVPQRRAGVSDGQWSKMGGTWPRRAWSGPWARVSHTCSTQLAVAPAKSKTTTAAGKAVKPALCVTPSRRPRPSPNPHLSPATPPHSQRPQHGHRLLHQHRGHVPQACRRGLRLWPGLLLLSGGPEDRGQVRLTTTPTRPGTSSPPRKWTPPNIAPFSCSLGTGDRMVLWGSAQFDSRQAFTAPASIQPSAWPVGCASTRRPPPSSRNAQRSKNNKGDNRPFSLDVKLKLYSPGYVSPGIAGFGQLCIQFGCVWGCMCGCWAD